MWNTIITFLNLYYMMNINFYVKSIESFIILSIMWYERLTQILPIAYCPIRVQGIRKDMPSNMLSFINFEPLELYWTYFLALQITTPTIPPMRLTSLDHEPKKWDDVLWAWTMGFDASLCKYELFWTLEEIFPKSMIVLTCCGSPMKWSRMKKFVLNREKERVWSIWDLKILT